MEPSHQLADAAWLSLAAILVFAMQAGFACLESGLVRAKNSINVVIKNLVDFLIAAFSFW
jgi:Amt family ammonium transporter